MRALEALATRETILFSTPDAIAIAVAANTASVGVPGTPDLVVVSKGRAFGLALKGPNGTLSLAERAAHLTLRDAGMRVEVARSLGEALEHLRDMGVVLRQRDDHDVGRHP